MGWPKETPQYNNVVIIKNEYFIFCILYNMEFFV
ncbi:hypothetical protein FPSM_00673 [Flavobacterium psychrophilum]|nr:hypothetical protein FPSM_00673 [Flavobacterium psychrophilum]